MRVAVEFVGTRRGMPLAAAPGSLVIVEASDDGLVLYASEDLATWVPVVSGPVQGHAFFSPGRHYEWRCEQYGGEPVTASIEIQE